MWGPTDRLISWLCHGESVLTVPVPLSLVVCWAFISLERDWLPLAQLLTSDVEKNEKFPWTVPPRQHKMVKVVF